MSKIRLIDFDMVTLSSLNRHAVATLADVGTPKVVACKRFLKRVAPWADIETRMELWQTGSLGESLIGDHVDWVIGTVQYKSLSSPLRLLSEQLLMKASMNAALVR